jgi:hypothetical protein
MSILSIDRTEIRFNHLCFIPLATTVETVTVAEAVWPDATPATNYTDFKIKELENLKQEREVETEPRLHVSETNAGWTEEKETTLKSKSYLVETSRTNALVKMLEYGLAVLPVAGTPVIPRERKQTYVDGVMLLETGVVALGVITERLQTWARCELVTPGDSTNKTAKVQLRFTELDSDNNTFELIDLDA